MPKDRGDFPVPLRRIRYLEARHGRYLVFLTKDMELPTTTMEGLHKEIKRHGNLNRTLKIRSVHLLEKTFLMKDL